MQRLSHSPPETSAVCISDIFIVMRDSYHNIYLARRDVLPGSYDSKCREISWWHNDICGRFDTLIFVNFYVHNFFKYWYSVSFCLVELLTNSSYIFSYICCIWNLLKRFSAERELLNANHTFTYDWNCTVSLLSDILFQF